MLQCFRQCYSVAVVFYRRYNVSIAATVPTTMFRRCYSVSAIVSFIATVCYTSSKALIRPVLSHPSDRVPMSVGVFVHGSIQSSGLLVHGNKSYADLFKTSHSLPRGKAIVGKVDLLVGSSLPLSSIRMIEVQGPERPLSDSQFELRPIADSSSAN
ncbi:hypothetical protein Q3G72_022755 [Acer saccharum]|nr:hypothetical protein Q3G72_022755 [Acer saccharum]